ncbi:MAG: ABC transporter substrate-binding protein [Gammaproteobacteria bacterium]|nr:MAG: ABC transporter substrate-binding protein [Gammaproteobacteria bacterium]
MTRDNAAFPGESGVLRVFGILICLLMLLGTPAEARRLASVNWCADRLLARLVPDELISVTWLMTQMPGSESDRARLRKDVVFNHGDVEEVIRLQPDAVVSGPWGSPALSRWLPRFGIQLWPLAEPRTPDDMVTLWRDWGQRLNGQEPDWVAPFQARRQAVVARARQLAADRPVRVLWVTPGGWLEAGGLVSAWLAELGWEDAALQVYGPGWHHLDLEAAAGLDVDVRVSALSGWPHPSLGSAWLEHPVLSRFQTGVPHVRIPPGKTGCALPEWLDALEQIVATVEQQRAGT